MAYTTFTYTTLKEALQRHTEDDFDDFTAELDTLIGLAELRVLRDLDLTIFDVTDETIVTAAGSNQITKPTGTITVQWLRSTLGPIDPRPLDWIEDYLQDADQGQPRFFAEESESTIRVAPVPDIVYSLKFRINKRPTGLGVSTPTTWLSEKVGDLLFAACMIEAEKFVREFDQGKKQYEQDYQMLLVQARAEHKDIVRRQYRPTVAQPAVLPAPHNRATA
jgi:hypothetical protein